MSLKDGSRLWPRLYLGRQKRHVFVSLASLGVFMSFQRRQRRQRWTGHFPDAINTRSIV